MPSFSTILRAPYRILSSATVTTSSYSPQAHLPGLALGRHHASWFLVYAKRPVLSSERVVMCLNFVIPGNPHSVGAISPSGNSVFTIGGYEGAACRVMDALRGLRDEQDRSPVAPTRYPAHDRYGLLADVEVLIPEDELIHACAYCGKWETQCGPGFLRCSGCKSRHYCSEECQKDDWKSQYHQGECQLLQDGNAYEVEARRKLHNNGWYFDYGPEGHQILRKDTGPHTYERAMYTSSVGYLAYGRRYPPHDVVPPRRPRPHPLPRDDGYPRGFLPTGYAWMDEAIKHMHVLKRGSSSRVLRELPKMYPVSQAVRAIDIPPFPPLPQTDGFVPTGDPFLDEQLLGEHLCKHGTAAQRGELETVVNARRESVEARKRLAVQREVRTAKAIEAAEKPKRYTRGTCV